MASAADGPSKTRTEIRLFCFTKKGPVNGLDKRSLYSHRSLTEGNRAEKESTYRRFVCVDLDGEVDTGSGSCYGSPSSWDAPVYTVDVVEAVNHIFPL